MGESLGISAAAARMRYTRLKKEMSQAESSAQDSNIKGKEEGLEQNEQKTILKQGAEDDADKTMTDGIWCAMRLPGDLPLGNPVCGGSGNR